MSEPKKEPAKASTVTMEHLAELSISQIAYMVRKDWKRPYFGCVPYIEAMLSIEHITDRYVVGDGTSVVRGFLANAQQYRGPIARMVKAELNKRLSAGKRAASAR